MSRHLADRRLGDKADMRRHAFFAAHRHGPAGGIEMDLLLTEIECRTAFAHALGLHPEHALVKLHTAVDIGNGQVQMVYALDLHHDRSEAEGQRQGVKAPEKYYR